MTMWALLLGIAGAALIATPDENTVRISGLLSLDNSSHGISHAHQIFSGSLGAGWQWKNVVNVSVRATSVGWVYLANAYGLLETYKESAMLTSSLSPWGTCLPAIVCYCLSHPDYGSETMIFPGQAERYYAHTMSVQSSAWSVEISVSTQSTVSSATLTSTQNTFTSSQLNVSTELNTSTDCFRNLSTSHKMIALKTNLSEVLFLESSWFGDQHNKIGYTQSGWTSDFNCNMFAGQLLIIPESPDSTSTFYSNMGWDIASLRNDPLHLFKTGVYPSELLEAILNSSNIASDNTHGCEIVSNVTTNATEVQKLFVSGSNGGTLNLTIDIPTSTFLDFITASPSHSPSLTPSNNPSSNPSSNPTYSPTSSPTRNPSQTPSGNPSTSPSQHPTNEPTSPSWSPTLQPSAGPSSAPVTGSPSSGPTNNPSASPSTSPSTNPSTSPSSNPSASPSSNPSTEPTRAPIPTASFSAELFGVLFTSGVSVEVILDSYVETIQSTVANQMGIAVSRVIVTRVTPSSRRRLRRNLLNQVLQVDFAVKGYLNTIDILKSQLEQPSNANAIAMSLGSSIPGATFFDVGLVSSTCSSGEVLFNNGIDLQCVSSCGIDQTLNNDGVCEDVVPQTIVDQPVSNSANYLARALYTMLGVFSWGFCVLIFNVCEKMRR